MEVRIGHKNFKPALICHIEALVMSFYIPWGCMQWDFSLLDNVRIWNLQILLL